MCFIINFPAQKGTFCHYLTKTEYLEQAINKAIGQNFKQTDLL